MTFLAFILLLQLSKPSVVLAESIFEGPPDPCSLSDAIDVFFNNQPITRYRNPIDPSIGFAWPIQGKRFMESTPVVLKETNDSAPEVYDLIAELGNRSEGIAYLALNTKKQAVTLKKIHAETLDHFPGDLEMYIALKNEKNKFAESHGVKTSKIHRVLKSGDDVWIEKDYIPGLSANAVLNVSHAFTSQSEVEKINEIVLQLGLTKKKLPPWNLKAHITIDTNAGNWIYFNGDWVMIDN